MICRFDQVLIEARVMQRFGHLSFDVTDIGKTKEFFGCLLSELGFQEKFAAEDVVCYSNSFVDVWFAKEKASRIARSDANPNADVVAEHTAFFVSNREKVKDVERAMRIKGFTPLFPAQDCPQFTEGYFAASFVGPDNIIFEVYTKPD